MTTPQQYTVRNANKTDGEAMLALLPRLAAFEIPDSRTAEHLWVHDAALLRDWIAGKADNCLVQVAENNEAQVVGVSLVTLRPELLSQEPSAHLEALAVADGVEGQGIGQMLLTAAEKGAVANGAETMTLHVFATNSRARKLYERFGYDGELVRYIKPIGA